MIIEITESSLSLFSRLFSLGHLRIHILRNHSHPNRNPEDLIERPLWKVPVKVPPLLPAIILVI